MKRRIRGEVVDSSVSVQFEASGPVESSVSSIVSQSLSLISLVRSTAKRIKNRLIVRNLIRDNRQRAVDRYISRQRNLPSQSLRQRFFVTEIATFTFAKRGKI